MLLKERIEAFHAGLSSPIVFVLRHISQNIDPKGGDLLRLLALSSIIGWLAVFFLLVN